MEQDVSNYSIETKTVFLNGKQITITNRTPVLTAEQREKRWREIEGRLYDIVKKHRSNAC